MRDRFRPSAVRPVAAAATALLATSLAMVTAAADPPVEEAFVSAEMRDRLDRTLGAAWSGVSLRAAADRLAETTGAAVLLDRRLDPDQPIELNAEGKPAAEVWRALAERSGAAATWLGPVVYLGPKSTAERLRTVAELRRRDAAALRPPLRDALLARRPISWDDLAEPRALTAELLAECGLRGVNLDLMPHDLWHRAVWPELTLVDRFTLVLAQFNVTFEVDAAAGTMRFTQLPERPTIVVRRTVGPADAARLAATWRAMVPAASIRTEGADVVVEGTVEDHQRLADLRAAAAGVARPAAAAKAAAGEVVFSLRVANVPLSKLIAALRAKQVDVRADAETLAKVGLSLDRPTSVDVRNAAPVDLLEAACKPLGLTARKAGTAIEIVPRE